MLKVTELDIANGACGTMVDIILNEEEEPVSANLVIQLTRSSTYVLFKMYRTKTTQLEGLDVGILPIQPMDRTYAIKVGPAMSSKTVHRHQLPLTTVCVFTDHRAQGQPLKWISEESPQDD